MSTLAVEIIAPSPIVVKLIYAITVKQCLTGPENSELLREVCNEPEILEVLGNLFAFNKQLIATTKPYKSTLSLGLKTYIRWGDKKDLNTVLCAYQNYLLELGFNVEELPELFPSSMPMRKMLSLKELAIVKLKLLQTNLLMLPADLTAKITNDDYATSLIKQNYINQKDGRRKIPKGLPVEAVKTLEDTLNSIAYFKENGEIKNSENSQKILTYLLNLLKVPQSKWPTTLTEERQHNILHLSAAFGPSYILKALIELGEFDEKFLTKSKSNTLHLSVLCQNIANVTFLIERFRNESEFINARNEDQRTPLHFAALLRNLDLITSLVNAGAELNVQDSDGNSPLHLANAQRFEKITELNRKAYEEYGKATELLLNYGISSELTNNNGFTAYEIYLIPNPKVIDYRSKEFEQYYQKKAERGVFLYAEQLEQENSLDLLINALRRSQGIIFFKEFARKNPEKILSYKDDQGNNVLHIINAARGGINGRVQYINDALLKTVAEHFTQLYLQENSQGVRGYNKVLEIIKHYAEVSGDINNFLSAHTYMYQNSSPAQRYWFLLPVAFMFPTIIGTVMLPMVLIADDPNPSDRMLGIIFSEVMIGLGALVFLYSVTPTRFWSSAAMKEMFSNILAFLIALPSIVNQICCSKKETFELREIVIENDATEEEKQPILAHHNHPAGMKFMKPVLSEEISNDFISALASIHSYLSEAKENSTENSQNLIEKFLKFLNGIMSSDNNDNSRALEVLDYFREQLSLAENKALPKEVLVNLEKKLELIRGFCSTEPISQETNSTVKY